MHVCITCMNPRLNGNGYLCGSTRFKRIEPGYKVAFSNDAKLIKVVNNHFL